MKQFVFYRNTKDRVSHEKESEVIDKMDDDKEGIAFSTFSRHCKWNEVAKNLGYGRDLPLSKDWSVGFYKSKYGGLPCYILGHTECDFIFLKPEDANMLQKQFVPDVGDAEWERHTGYGPNRTIDPVS